MKIELIKYPTEQDWAYCKTCTLNTVGKKIVNTQVSSEWKRKILESEHSPIRELWFGFKMEIPYWVSVHFTRHHEGVNHFVQTQRTDRTGIDRNELPQGAMVSHIMTINAQALMNMARKRLCKQASKETREVMYIICKEAIQVCPELEGLLVANCGYRNGKCTEFFPCKEI
jgi:hypothetical protein